MDVIPSENEIILAREASRALARTLSGKSGTVKVRVGNDGPSVKEVLIPLSALKMLVHLLGEMARGNSVTLTPLHAELTTQEAADILNVSRPFLIKLLDEKKIPYRKVGRHRRVYARDIFAFKSKQDLERAEAIDTIVSEAQRLNLGYE
ncbi:MAG: helix-turn-helix domain-containing protein [Calothrix sp. SM1_5_4]|nr:helix-turn-helix domain-containing protein [Calothrix sp. SM1_5_4]